MAVLHTQLDITSNVSGSLTSLRKNLFDGNFHKRIGKGAGNFLAELNNQNGIFSGTFSVGDKVELYLDANNPPTTKEFVGTIESQRYESRNNQEYLILNGRDYTRKLTDVTATEVYNDKTTAYVITDLGGKYFTENRLLNDFETAAKAGSFIAIGSPTTDAIPTSIGSMTSTNPSHPISIKHYLFFHI